MPPRNRISSRGLLRIDEVREQARLSAAERPRIVALAARAAGQRPGDEQADAFLDERTVHAEARAGVRVEVRDGRRARPLVGLLQRGRNLAGLDAPAPDDARTSNGQADSRAAAFLVGGPQAGGDLHRLQRQRVGEEERGPHPVRVGDVHVAEPPGGLRPRAAADAREARLADVEAAALHAVQDGRRLDRLEDRPQAVAHRQALQQVHLELGAERAARALRDGRGRGAATAAGDGSGEGEARAASGSGDGGAGGAATVSLSGSWAATG